MLSRRGAPARVLEAWIEGEFELLVSPLLIGELERALAYPKLRKRIRSEDAQWFVEWLQRAAITVEDPGSAPPVHSSDRGDDYLLSLAAGAHAALVSGDSDLLEMEAAGLPIYAPADFLALIKPPG